MSCLSEPRRNWCLACTEDRPEDCTADAFGRYLSEPCDHDGCSSSATHNQPHGKFCNQHCDWALPAFARDD